MKHKRLILLAAVLVAVFVVAFFYWPCFDCWFDDTYKKKTTSGYRCTGQKTVGVQTLSRARFDEYNKNNKNNEPAKMERYDRVDSVQVPFVCNELIFAPKLAGTDEYRDKMRKYLRCQGFKLEHTCDCSDELELWTYQDLGDANLIEVVKDPPKDNSGQNIGGLLLNYTIIIDKKESRLNADTSQVNNDYTFPEQPKSGSQVIIGVSDSGVDLDGGSPFLSNGFLWDKSMSSTPFCIEPGNNGLGKLTAQKQPTDLIGHGTFINGIIIGAAMRNGEQQAEEKDLLLKVLNIKNSDEHSFSVFNAICGLYFGAQQGVKIFNISWGFLEEHDSTQAPKVFQMFLNSYPDVVLIAGMGNKGNGENSEGVRLDDNARFWPACLAETESRVISVGALNEKGTALASFSNFSQNPNRMTIQAPGENILSRVPKSLQPAPATGFAFGSGTSYATPFVTRKIAALSIVNPDPPLMKSTLLNSLGGNTVSELPAMNQ